MRIIGGRYQRKKFLPLPQNLSTRPTLDRVRETLFQRLENRQALQGARVLDAFAGTGALGLEALSRGADTVTFIENSLTIMDYLKHNVVHIVPPEDHDKIRFHQAASPAFFPSLKGPFDLIFLDPPYKEDDLYHKTLQMIIDRALLAPEGIIVIETPKNMRLDAPLPLHNSFTKTSGKITVSFFQAETI